MDGLDFFEQYSGLRLPALTAKLGPGVCQYCGRDRILYQRGKLVGCSPCFTIRMGHLGPSNKKLTLAKWDYALVAKRGTIFYTNLKIPNVNTAEILTGDNIYRMFYNLIIKPPQSPFLLIHFGKPTETGNFQLNTVEHRDFLTVSGDPLIGTLNCQSIKAWLVCDLMRRFPKLTAKDWKQVIHAQDRFRDPSAGEQAVKTYTEYSQCAGIFDALPPLRSVETKILEVSSRC